MVASWYANGFGTTGPHMIGRSRLDSNLDTQVGMIYVPGGGGTELSWQTGTTTNPNQAGLLLQYLCSDDAHFSHRDILNRFITVQSNWTWGNQTEVDIISSAFIHAQKNYGFAPHKVHLIGASMGTTCILNWATQNISKVASITCMLPAVNPQEIEDDGLLTPYIPASIPAQPSASFSGGGVIPTLYNPSQNTAVLKQAPIGLWYSNNDTVCLPAQVQSFGTAVNARMTNLGDMAPFLGIPGHNLVGLDNQQILDFLLAHSP